jgi:8-oxo-dGTP pyrophosphatase MutT (NUDIX family)
MLQVINPTKHPTAKQKRVSQIDIIDRKGRYFRAGIIPFVEANGLRYYGFGLSVHNGSIFDFGGHREPEDNDLVETAVRECMEESLGVFGDSITYDDIIENDYEVIDGLEGSNPIGTLEILVPIKVDMYMIMLKFRELVSNDEKPELANIIWLSSDQIVDIYRVQHPIKVNHMRPFHTYYRLAIPLNRWAIKQANSYY